MPRQFGGHTPIGNTLNSIGSKQEGLRVSRARTRTGSIIAFATGKMNNDKQVLARATNPKSDGLYKFIVRLDDGTETGFLTLVGRAVDHAMLKGHPSELLGQTCYIAFEGPSSNRGRILDVVDDQIDTLTVAGNNQLQITGAAFAPPGNGLI
jgi:hypothetical protein